MEPCPYRREQDLICAGRGFLHACPFHSTPVGVSTAFPAQAGVLSSWLLTGLFCGFLQLSAGKKPPICHPAAGDCLWLMSLWHLFCPGLRWETQAGAHPRSCPVMGPALLTCWVLPRHSQAHKPGLIHPASRLCCDCTLHSRHAVEHFARLRLLPLL